MIGFENIVFEGRNKDYGAFQLRKKYHKTVIVCAIVGNAIVLLPLSIFLLITMFEPISKSIQIERFRSIAIELANLPLPEVQEEVKQPITKAKTITEPLVTDNEETMLDKQEDKPIQQALDEDLKNKENEDSLLKTNPKDTLYFSNEIDADASFLGGEAAFRRFISTNFVWPKLDKGFQGKITIEFDITKNGEIKNVAIIVGSLPSIDSEIRRVISKSPKWKPAIKNGKAIQITYSLNIYLKNN